MLKGGFMYQQRVLTQVSLHELHKMTWVEIFCQILQFKRPLSLYVLSRFIPSLPNLISPIPISPKIFPFPPFFFRPFQLRPFPIPPNIFPALLPFRPISFSPIFHFEEKPSRPTFPFRPMTILPFSHKALPISPEFHFSDIWTQN